MTTTADHFRGLPPPNRSSQADIGVENMENKEYFVTNGENLVRDFSLMNNYKEQERNLMIHENNVGIDGNNGSVEKVQGVNHSKEDQQLEVGSGISNEHENPDSESEIRHASRNMREKRISDTHRAATCLEKTLGHIKESTKKMLNEIDIYMKVTQEVELDYIRCQKSQRNEARRLQEVEPDITGVTSRFYRQE